jgi:hypothetical protein
MQHAAWHLARRRFDRSAQTLDERGDILDMLGRAKKTKLLAADAPE